jgi:hypothetical protein
MPLGVGISRSILFYPELCLFTLKPFESNMVVTFTNRVGAASQQLISTARAIFIADAHRCDGKCFVVRADKRLRAKQSLS